MYDDRGRILASRSQAAGSGLRAYANYKFPGGGIEPNEDVIAAAKKELLEEAGYEQGGEMFEFGTRTPVDWDPSFREQAAKKGRGGYHGQYEYYVAGPLGKRNTSHFGSEGDAMTGLEMVRRERLRKALERTANDPKNEYGYFDKQKLVALDALDKELARRGLGKTAALSEGEKYRAVIIECNPFYTRGRDAENYRRYYNEIKEQVHAAGYDDVIFDEGADRTIPP